MRILKMSFKSNWLQVLASLKTSIKPFLKDPNVISNYKTLENAIEEFITFADGHSALLQADTKAIAVINQFNETLTYKVSTDFYNLSDCERLDKFQDLLDKIDTAILNLNEDSKMTNINIGNISGGNNQFGADSTQNNSDIDIDIDLKTLIHEIQKSNDPEAKNKLKALLENNTVASIIGASVPALLQLLQIS